VCFLCEVRAEAEHTVELTAYKTSQPFGRIKILEINDLLSVIIIIIIIKGAGESRGVSREYYDRTSHKVTWLILLYGRGDFNSNNVFQEALC